MTQDSIRSFLEHQEKKGVSQDSLRKRKGFVTALFSWLPEDKELTRERLSAWREDMLQRGYSQQTVLNHVKGINLYLEDMGRPELRFTRGRARDIRDKTFGYLTPVEPTGSRDRRDIVWRCRCRCGNTVELPATRLLRGNTLSCGCMRSENILAVNRNIAGTHLSMSLKEKITNPGSASGYTGVARKRDKWFAYINYRGRRYHLGTFSDLEDAVKARARAKQLVMEDALQLQELYERVRGENPGPDRSVLSVKAE